MCRHPRGSRLVFCPSTTGAHERCIDCDAVRYQTARGSAWWWNWPDGAGKVRLRKLHPKLAFVAARAQ